MDRIGRRDWEIRAVSEGIMLSLSKPQRSPHLIKRDVIRNDGYLLSSQVITVFCIFPRDSSK